MFKNCLAPIPYWSLIENKKDRNVAIKIFTEKEELLKKIPSKTNNTIQIKSNKI